MNDLHIYVGHFGEYVVPKVILDQAKSLNGDKPQGDKRTKGARHIEWWGKNQDAQKMMMESLNINKSA